jgi:transcriptional regulator with XRE-family HTH domain
LNILPISELATILGFGLRLSASQHLADAEAAVVTSRLHFDVTFKIHRNWGGVAMSDNADGCSSDFQTFGQLVREHREALGWTLEGVATAIYNNGDRKSYLSEIESGNLRIRASTAEKIAKHLKIEIDKVPRSLRWPENKDEFDTAVSKVNLFQKTVQKDDFLKWRLEATICLYSDSLKFLGKAATIFPKIGNINYPIAILPPASNGSLLECAIDRLHIEECPHYPTPAELQRNNYPIKLRDVQLSESQQEYLSIMLLSEKIRRPNQPGYALSNLSLDEMGSVTSFESKVCHYMDNVRTCHHIEYGLFKAFERGEKASEKHKYFCELGEPRIEISENCKSLAISGTQQMFPLISVQAICLFRRRGEWSIAYVKRSDNVAVAAGAYQFVPAGGFETIGGFDLSHISSRESDRLQRGFNIEDALLRELLEELFRDASMVAGGGAADVDNLPGLAICRDLIRDKKLEIRSLGVVLDLVRLRPEFSYLIIFRDEEPNKIEYDTSLEDGRVIKARFGFTNTEEANEFESMPLSKLRERLNKEIWHESSAGLGSLVLTHLENDPEFCKEL